ncbi:MAG: tyrosine-type recombinase/integrase [Actinobacteria bacterium]|nr:tyrosine-type recombinase/integrase [Actinomycetota bacterium]
MHAKTFPTKTLARRWAADMEADVRRGDWADPGRGRVTFGEWTHEFLGTIVHLRAVTQGDYERALRVHVLPTFEAVPVSRIDHVDVRRFIAEKQAEGLAPKTLQRVRLVLRQVLALAKSAGAIKSNPCDGLRLPRPARVEPVFLTAAQVEALAQAAKPPFDVLVRLAAASGLRPSELCGLRLGRIDIEKGTVEVAEALTVVKGRTEVGPTKNSLRRTVGIPKSVCEDLAAYIAARAEAAGRPLEAQEFLFTAPMGGPLRRDLLFKRFIRPAITKADLPAGLRLHDLRHTCAALLISLGAHPKAIQERLGHSSITVTIDVYGHLFPSIDQALTHRLDEALRAARPPDSLPVIEQSAGTLGSRTTDP